MAGTCSLCGHPDQEAIDRAILDGESTRSIAARYPGMSHMAVQRHKPHVGEALAKARELALAEAVPPAVQEAEYGGTLLQQITGLQGRAENVLSFAERVLSRVEESGDVRETCQAIQAANSSIREVRGILELLAKAVALIPPDGSTIVNITTAPEWVEIRTVVLQVLEPYPDARALLAERLAEVTPAAHR